jgi:hypothetical protein
MLGTCTINDWVAMYGLLSTEPHISSRIKVKPELNKVICTGNGPNRMIQKVPVLNGRILDSNYPYHIHNCVKNEVESVYRQLSCNVKCDKSKIKDFALFCNKYIDKIVSNASSEDILLRREWLERYSGNKRRGYEKAMKDLEDGRAIKPSNMKMHVKTDEKLKIGHGGTIKIKARNITAQEDLSKIIMGPIVESISNCQKRIDEGYGSGLNHQQRCEKFSKWHNSLLDPVILCLDGSAFDSTQHKEILDILDVPLMLKFYQKFSLLFDQDPYSKYIESILKNRDQKVYSKNFHYIIEGTQATGKMNTSQGNTTRSLLYIRYAASKCGLQEGEWYMEASGDDTIIFIERAIKDKFIESLYEYVYSTADPLEDVTHGLGQIAKKVDEFDDITGVEYLSCHLISNGDEIVMMRKLDRLLQLSSWTYKNNFKNPNKRDRLNKGLLVAEGQNIKSQCHDIKLFNKMADMFIRLGDGHYSNSRDKEYHVDRSDSRFLTVNESYERFLCRFYGLTRKDLRELYNFFDNNNDMYAEFTLRLIDRVEGNDMSLLENLKLSLF